MSLGEETITLGDCGENCNTFTINGPANAISLILLLMLDQMHDFGEEVRSGASDVSSSWKANKLDLAKEKESMMNELYRYIDDYIQTMKYSRSPNEDPIMVSFSTFLGADRDFSSIYDTKVFKDQDSKSLMSGENKYNVANEIIGYLGIRDVNIENVKDTFVRKCNNQTVATSCNDITNIMYQYMLFSGYVSTNQIPDKVRIIVDANKSKYSITPLLNNICDFILGSGNSFTDVKLVRSIATEYDAATTSSVETIMGKLYDKRNLYVSNIEKLIQKLLVKYQEQVHISRNSPGSEDVALIASLEQDMRKLELERKILERKSIAIDKIFKGVDQSVRYVVNYGTLPIIDYTLDYIKDKSLLVNYNDKPKSVYEKMLKFSKSFRVKIYQNTLDKLFYIMMPKVSKPDTLTALKKKLEEALKIASKNDPVIPKGIVIVSKDFISNMSPEEFKFSRWTKFYKTKDNKVSKEIIEILKPLEEFNEKWVSKSEIPSEIDQDPALKKEFVELVKKFNRDYNSHTSARKKVKVGTSKSSSDPEHTHDYYMKEFIKLCDFLRYKKLGEVSADVYVTIPRIDTWLNYDQPKLHEAGMNLTYSGGVIRDDYVDKGMSQAHIFKTIMKLDSSGKPLIPLEDRKYYYIFKTIGDLSQILECAKYSLSGDNTVSMFLTFDRICGRISSLFNRTIMEETGKNSAEDRGNLYDIRTFIYGNQADHMENFGCKYEDISNELEQRTVNIRNDFLAIIENNKKQLAQTNPALVYNAQTLTS